jgi:type IV pilus assembly protein PilV
LHPEVAKVRFEAAGIAQSPSDARDVVFLQSLAGTSAAATAADDRAARRRVPVTMAIPRTRSRRPPAHGFSLVEVLVSMFVVSLGILALAGLLQASTRYAKMSELRSTATLLANDIADRIRANPVGAQRGADGYDLAEPVYPSPLPSAHAACTGEAPCGPSDLARADMFDWTARLRSTLPKGSAFVRLHPGVAPAGDSVDVWVGWNDPDALAPGIASERTGTECPPAWSGTETSVRCIYLQVAL